MYELVTILYRPQCVKNRNGNVDMMKYLPVAELEVAKMTNSGPASDKNFLSITTFLFQ